MKEVAIVSASRTAVGTMGGAIKDVPAADLGATAIKSAVEKAGIEKELIEEVVMGCVGQVAENAFVARMCALQAGLPETSTAYTVNRLCGSGLQAINNAVQQIQTDNADIVVAGGTENMDLLPYYVRKGRYGYKMGHGQLEDGLLTALTDPFGQYHMGVTAENVAERYGITREEQDEFAVKSQHNAINAIDNDYFKEEIVPVELKDRKGNIEYFDTDEHPRREASVEKLAKMKPVFREGGSVTPANSSGINNGAAALVVMSKDKADELGLKPLAVIKEQSVAGIDPSIMGYAPTPAVQKLVKKSGVSLNDVDLLELNEAFAAQSLAVIRDLEVNPDKVNVNGGAIALGHPIGASGAIITVKLLHELQRRGQKRGISTMCIGGGQGIATLFELCD
ncbi:acetyl-CoA C-acetyltransferase [Salibacterium salarium]|uniref:acetyl-CoA C-acetyltransferase n=1 Tax=Salibacterium salarium TaxID=284579 RepID=A0A428N5N1_9BACI|nr:acetyl-CoA C-acetyltransferase [Salibacterium salarium]RSL33557.1 acetyl-CoA C-acetyltransferase [Salibacterium salarium]